MLLRISISFNKETLLNNSRRIISSLARGADKSYTLPTLNDGFFEHELQLLVDSLPDTLCPLLHGEDDPQIGSTSVTMSLSLYSERQKKLIPSKLESYMCNTIAYGWFVRNGFSYDVIDMDKVYNELHHAILLKDAPYSRKPGF